MENQTNVPHAGPVFIRTQQSSPSPCPSSVLLSLEKAMWNDQIPSNRLESVNHFNWIRSRWTFNGCFPTKCLLLSHATLDKDYRALAKQEAAKFMFLSQRHSCSPIPDLDGMQTIAESRQLETGAGLTCTLLSIQPEVDSVLPQSCHHPSWIQCQSVLLLLFVGRFSCSTLTFIWNVDISEV